MQVTTALQNHTHFSRPAVGVFSSPPPNDDNGDSWTSGDTIRLAGGVLGGTALGGGLGYLGLNAGMEFGLKLASDSFSGHPLLQLFGIIGVGLPLGIAYGVIGGAAGLAAGATAGGALGAYLGDKIAGDR